MDMTALAMACAALALSAFNTWAIYRSPRIMRRRVYSAAQDAAFREENRQISARKMARHTALRDAA